MRTFILLFACVSLAACGGSDPIADPRNDANAAALPDVESFPPDEMTATGDAEGNAADVRPVDRPATIPAAFHGRWGLAPADCEPGRSDAKGLMVVAADGLRFYESRAVLAEVKGTSDSSISGEFAFEGEGMRWKRNMSLQLQDGKLVRTETAPMASYTYARCR